MNAVRLLGSLLGNNATGGNLLGTLIKGAAGGGGGGGNPLGALGGLLGGGGGRPASGGGAAGLLGAILGGGGGGATGGGGGAGGLLGSILGGGGAQQQQQAQPQGGGGVGGLLGSILGGKEAPAPPPEAQDQATILIRAMCNAAKSDGNIDAAEQEAIVGRLGGDLDQQEVDFLKKELSSPLDVQGFVNSVPQGLGPQVYAMSLMAVKVDTQQEAQYLQQLAQGLKLDAQVVGQIHQQVGLA